MTSLIISDPPCFRNDPGWGGRRAAGDGRAGSDFSGAALNMRQRSNLLLTVAGLFLASKQLSRSNEALPG